MKAIILAAGQGIRLRKVTCIPKGLLSLGSETILEREVRLLRELGIEEILIVVGYKSHLLEEEIRTKNLGLKIIRNHLWKVQAGNLFSLSLALPLVEEFIVLNGDLIFDKRMLRKLIRKEDSDIVMVGKRELSIAKFSRKGKERLEELLKKETNWGNAGVGMALRKLNAEVMIARYYCFDIDYPKDMDRWIKIVEDEGKET